MNTAKIHVIIVYEFRSDTDAVQTTRNINDTYELNTFIRVADVLCVFGLPDWTTN